MYSFSLQKYKRNQVVYHQGEKASMVYLLNSGELEITRVKKNKYGDRKDTNQIGKYAGFVSSKLG